MLGGVNLSNKARLFVVAEGAYELPVEVMRWTPFNAGCKRKNHGGLRKGPATTDV